MLIWKMRTIRLNDTLKPYSSISKQFHNIVEILRRKPSPFSQHCLMQFVKVLKPLSEYIILWIWFLCFFNIRWHCAVCTSADLWSKRIAVFKRWLYSKPHVIPTNDLDFGPMGLSVFSWYKKLLVEQVLRLLCYQ